MKYMSDSSRYFYMDGMKKGNRTKNLKNSCQINLFDNGLFNGFQGLEGQTVPEMSDDYITSVSERYIELYEKLQENCL